MPSASPCVHLVDEDAPFLDTAARWLGVAGIAAFTYLTPQAFLDSYDPERPGCLVTEARLHGMAEAADATCARIACALPVVMVAAQADVALVVAAMRQGAVDFLAKPLARAALLDSVQRALAQDRQQRLRAAQQATLE